MRSFLSRFCCCFFTQNIRTRETAYIRTQVMPYQYVSDIKLEKGGIIQITADSISHANLLHELLTITRDNARREERRELGFQFSLKNTSIQITGNLREALAELRETSIIQQDDFIRLSEFLESTPKNSLVY